jgi:DNA-binding transcriptional LysR family regulator
VRLTPDGQRILGRIEHAFSVIDDAADSWRKPRRRSVRIATTASFAQIWLLPRLERIEKELGQTRVEVLAAQQNANLATFEADIAIRYGRGGWNTEYEEKLFAQEALVPVVSRKLSQQTGRKPTAEKIASVPLLHDSDSTCWRAWFSSHRLQFRNKPADRVLGDYMLTLAAAAEGLGVALLNKPLGAPGLLESQLVELGLESAPAPLSYHVLARASGADSAVVQCLRILRDRVS